MDTPTVPDRWRELTTTQRDILVTLAKIGPASNLEINRALGRDDTVQGTIANNLKTLRGLGLVTTTPATNRTTSEKTNGLSDDAVELLWASVVDAADALREGPKP